MNLTLMNTKNNNHTELIYANAIVIYFMYHSYKQRTSSSISYFSRTKDLYVNLDTT